MSALTGPTRRVSETTEAIKPGTPGRVRHRPLKPLRRECRTVWLTCGDDSRVFLVAREAAGAAKHPAFPAPSFFVGDPPGINPDAIRAAGTKICA